MKNIVLIVLINVFVFSLYATDYYVGTETTDCHTLDEALNAADFDTDNIILRDSQTEYTLSTGNTYHLLRANLKSLSNNPHNCIINVSGSRGFTIDNNQTNITIKGLTIKGLNYSTNPAAISLFKVTGSNTVLNLENNIIKQNYGQESGVISNTTTDGNVNLKDNIFYLNSAYSPGIDGYGCVVYMKCNNININATNNIFYRNRNTNISTSSYSIYTTKKTSVSSVNHIIIKNNTFIEDSVPICIKGTASVSNTQIINNIFYKNGAVFYVQYYNGSMVIDNNCFFENAYINNFDVNNGNTSVDDVLISMTNTKMLDPKMSNPLPNPSTDQYFYKSFYLVEGSQCIDGSTLTSSNSDLDEGRDDIGYINKIDTKILNPSTRWTWACFPRLNRSSQGNTTANILTYLNADHLGTIPATMSVKYKENNFAYSSLNWDNSILSLNSTQMCKIQISDSNLHYYHSLWDSSRTERRVDKNTTFTLTAGQDNWIGYFLPNNQNLNIAFGSNFDNVESIKSENWYYQKNESQTKDSGAEPLPSSTIRPLEYGKGYIIRVKQTVTIPWFDSQTSVPSYVPSNTKTFTNNALPDYEAIDIMELEDSGKAVVDEIGVFENGICIGAVAVEQFPVQLLAYTDSMNRSMDNLKFKITYKNQKGSVEIPAYQIYNEKNNKYELNTLNSGFGYARIKLKNNSSNPMPYEKVSLSQNYPNPFNPSTSISFTIPKASEIELNIYNIKGQLVKTLAKGSYSAGKQSIEWSGTDNQGTKVSSGIYLYRLKTGNNVISRKMLMIK